MSKPFRIEILKEHDRKAFECGVEALDEYFRLRVGQDVRRRVTFCYVAVDNATDQIAGYYTLSAGSVMLGDLSEKIARRLPRYPTVPIVRIGRLAVDSRFKGCKLGSTLLWDALKRSFDSEIAAYAAVVDAKDDNAAQFYKPHGFVSLSRTEMTLFLPLGDAFKQLADGGG